MFKLSSSIIPEGSISQHTSSVTLRLVSTEIKQYNSLGAAGVRWLTSGVRLALLSHKCLMRSGSDGGKTLEETRNMTITEHAYSHPVLQCRTDKD